MKMFEMLDALHEKNKKEEIIIPVEVPKNCIDKISDVKEYKRQYYLKNIEIYRERNKQYRLRKKSKE
jgi:hypothetical protein